MVSEAEEVDSTVHNAVAVEDSTADTKSGTVYGLETFFFSSNFRFGTKDGWNVAILSELGGDTFVCVTTTFSFLSHFPFYHDR